LPTYEYACTECGHRLEAVQSFSDDPLTTCSECGGTLRKVYGAVGIVLKGSGFYKTDSRATAGAKGSSSSSSTSAGSGDAGSSSDGAAAPKSDSKSDAASTGSGPSKDAAPAASGSST